MSATWAAFCTVLMLLLVALLLGFLIHENNQLQLQVSTAGQVQKNLAEENATLRSENEALRKQAGELQSKVKARDETITGLNSTLDTCHAALQQAQQTIAQPFANTGQPTAQVDGASQASGVIPVTCGPNPLALVNTMQPGGQPTVFGLPLYIIFGAILFAASSFATIFHRGRKTIRVMMTRADASAFRQWQRARRS